MSKQQEWDEWMEQIQLPAWLKANPGKTKEDWQIERQLAIAKITKDQAEKEDRRIQAEAEIAAWKTAQFVIFVFNWFGIPSLLAFAIGFVSTADFFPRFMCGLIITFVLKIFGVVK